MKLAQAVVRRRAGTKKALESWKCQPSRKETAVTIEGEVIRELK